MRTLLSVALLTLIACGGTEETPAPHQPAPDHAQTPTSAKSAKNAKPPLIGRLTFEATRMSKKKPNQRMQAWIDARKRHRFSHAQVQMARELGMNPSKLGKLDNHDQEPWKMPLRQYIGHLYFKRFGKTAPDRVVSIEERARLEQQKKDARRAAKQQRATEPT